MCKRTRFPSALVQAAHWHYVDCVRWLGDCLLSKSVTNRIVEWQPDTSSELHTQEGHVVLMQARARFLAHRDLSIGLHGLQRQFGVCRFSGARASHFFPSVGASAVACCCCRRALAAPLAHAHRPLPLAVCSAAVKDVWESVRPYFYFMVLTM